jgi:hypothetical protein
MRFNLFNGFWRVARSVVGNGFGDSAVAIYGNGRNGRAAAQRVQGQ